MRFELGGAGLRFAGVLLRRSAAWRLRVLGLLLGDCGLRLRCGGFGRARRLRLGAVGFGGARFQAHLVALAAGVWRCSLRPPCRAATSWAVAIFCLAI